MKINNFTPDTKIFNSVGSENQQQESQDINESFYNVLKDKLDGVNEQQVEAENTTEAFINGDEQDVHNVMLATEEAKMSLELAVQVRNKLVEAYQELNRMQM